MDFFMDDFDFFTDSIVDVEPLVRVFVLLCDLHAY